MASQSLAPTPAAAKAGLPSRRTAISAFAGAVAFSAPSVATALVAGAASPRAAFDAAAKRYRNAYALNDAAVAATDKLLARPTARPAPPKLLWYPGDDVLLNGDLEDFHQLLMGEDNYVYLNADPAAKAVKVDADIAAIMRWRSDVARVDAPLEAAWARQFEACEAVSAAIEAMIATPAPDLAAVLFKVEAAMTWACEVDELEPIKADLRRLGSN